MNRAVSGPVGRRLSRSPIGRRPIPDLHDDLSPRSVGQSGRGFRAQRRRLKSPALITTFGSGCCPGQDGPNGVPTGIITSSVCGIPIGLARLGSSTGRLGPVGPDRASSGHVRTRAHGRLALRPWLRDECLGGDAGMGHSGDGPDRRQKLWLASRNLAGRLRREIVAMTPDRPEGVGWLAVGEVECGVIFPVAAGCVMRRSWAAARFLHADRPVRGRCRRMRHASFPDSGPHSASVGACAPTDLSRTAIAEGDSRSAL